MDTDGTFRRQSQGPRIAPMDTDWALGLRCTLTISGNTPEGSRIYAWRPPIHLPSAESAPSVVKLQLNMGVLCRRSNYLLLRWMRFRYR